MFPLLLLVPVAGTAIGGLLGADSASKEAEAKRLGVAASKRHAEAVAALEFEHERAMTGLAFYAKLRLELFDGELRMLQQALKRIGGVNATPLADVDLNLAAELKRFDLNDADFSAVDAVKAAAAAAGAGAATYFASLGAVGALGLASTGTPIAALSGAAAANATMAWFASGSVAAGGLGVGVGAAVLGGVVLGPVLSVGGLVLNGQAGKHLEQAKDFDAKVTAAVEQLATAGAAAEVLARRAYAFSEVAAELSDILAPLARHARAIAQAGRAFGNLTAEERTMLHFALETARTLKGLLETPLMTPDGAPAPKADATLAQSREFVAAAKS